MSTIADGPGSVAAPSPASGRLGVRVLVPYIATYFGGVRRVLADGLPRLAAIPGLCVTYAELCCNAADMDGMERSGVAVDRTVGTPGRSVLGGGGDIARVMGIAGQVPRLVRLAWRLSCALRGYDVCYVHGHREVMVATAALALLPRAHEPALVWHWHGPPLSVGAGARGSWSAKAVARLGASKCARLIAISEFSADLMRRMGVPPERTTTVLNAAEVAPPPAQASGDHQLPERAPDQITLLLPCASIRENKGVHLAIDALGALTRKHVLWITGDAADPLATRYVAELRRRAVAAGATDRVRFIGMRRDVHAVMCLADLVLVPTTSEEPFGLVAAEAQLLGIPVVASNRGALPEIVGEGRGLTFDPDCPGALAAAAARVTADPALRHRTVEAARRRAERLFSYDRWRDEVADVLLEAAAARSRPHRDG